MLLQWIKCNTDDWCNFLTLNLTSLGGVAGVYVIWRRADGLVVRVGQGEIAQRISAHRLDRDITRFEDLIVAWASVDARYRDGVERFLADQLAPVVGSGFPDVAPIAINLPGA